MKRENCVVVGMLAAVLASAVPGNSASIPNAAGTPAEMVITVRPAAGGSAPGALAPGDVKVFEGNSPAPVIGLRRLAGDLADMQLVVLLDDSTRSSSLSLQLPELKRFLESLPATTQVAVGYMRNGTPGLAQSFTADHQKAASALRLPMAIPGENGSPYFVLSDLVKHWPSKQPTLRRAVLMLTDGVDRYYSTRIMEDPYVDAAVHDALKEGVMVYSIYLRGAGLYGRGAWLTNLAQSCLIEVGQETGGYAYFEDMTDPVTISPFLKDLQDRIENQYELTIAAPNGKGVQPVKLRTELPGVKISGPTQVYVQ